MSVAPPTRWTAVAEANVDRATSNLKRAVAEGDLSVAEHHIVTALRCVTQAHAFGYVDRQARRDGDGT